MSLPNVLFGRLRKLLRAQFGIETATLRPRHTLGRAPMGFTDDFIARELRVGVNWWFSDLIPPFEMAPWNGDTTMSDVVGQILERASATTSHDYRMHLMTLPMPR